MKRILLLCVCLGLIFCGCGKESSIAEKKQEQATNKLLDEANRQIGMPNIINFQQKKIMKMIYEACDKEDLICHAYVFSDFKGQLIYVGDCIGYGVPFSAQYTNPMKGVDIGNKTHYSFTALPQADPNGLYMPTSSSATWLLMIDPETKKPRLTYWEPTIIVSPFYLHKVNHETTEN